MISLNLRLFKQPKWIRRLPKVKRDAASGEWRASKEIRPKWAACSGRSRRAIVCVWPHAHTLRSRETRLLIQCINIDSIDQWKAIKLTGFPGTECIRRAADECRNRKAKDKAHNAQSHKVRDSPPGGTKCTKIARKIGFRLTKSRLPGCLHGR